MRVRGYSGSSSMPVDSTQCFLMGRLVVYLERLLSRYERLDLETLEVLYWLLGPELVEKDLVPLATMLDGGDKRRRYGTESDAEIRHARDFAHMVDQALCRAGRDEEKGVVHLLRGYCRKGSISSNTQGPRTLRRIWQCSGRCSALAL